MPSSSDFSSSIGLTRLSGFGAGDAASTLSITLAPMLLLYFLTEYVHVDPWLGGVILAIPKLWDVLVDMPIGRYSDQLAARMGGHLNVGMWSALGLVLLLPLTFLHPQLGPKPLLAMFFISVQILQATCYTVFGVTNLALVVELASDSVQRNKLLTARNLGSYLATITLIVSTPMLIRCCGEGERGYVSATLIVAAAAALLFAWYFVTMRNAPRQSTTLSATSAGMSLRQCVASLIRNRAFLALIVVIVALGAASGCINSLIAYLNKYLLGRRPEDLFVLAGPILIGSLVGLPLAVPVARRIGNSQVLRWGVIVLVVSFMGYWLGLVRNGLPVIIVGGAGYGIAGAAVSVALMATMLDAAKSDQSGVPLGLYLGMILSAQKLGMSLGAMASGGLLSIIGYQAGAPMSSALHHSFAALSLAGPLGAMLIACVALWLYRNHASKSRQSAEYVRL
ncbi:MFS transporter [Paraburkholderia oxyphila]|uniref:MFS transporter n=1 Tax=Paraburkholderia oxyphila TaxID=614212 RepID=UPI0005BDBDCC|nr:MFS transporter [Paraburkholderia oxyphila]